MKLSTIASLLVTVATLGAGPTAFADAAPADAAPAAGAHAGARVSVAGEVGRYVVGPLGHVRGFILKDGTPVLLHESAGDAMAKDVPVGQSVRVEGWSPAGQKVIFRPAVYGQHGQVVTPSAGRESEAGARGERRAAMREELSKLPEASANGTVATVLPGRRGTPSGVVLTDGTTVLLRRSLAHALASRGIRPGDRIESRGKGGTYPLGASIFAGSVTFADGTHFEARSRANADR